MNYGLKEKIISLRQDGKTYNEISSILSCSKGTISFHCSKLENNETIKFENREIISIHKNKYLEWDDKTIHIIKLLYNYGINTNEIADIFNLDIHALRSYCTNLLKTDYSSITSYQRVKRRRKKIKILAVIYKGYQCKKCGYNKYFENLEFHHKDPNLKDFSISQQCNRRWSVVKKELDKCDMYCAICHREIHIEQKGSSLTPAMLLE